MKFLVNKKLATRIGIITTVITLVGMLLLWIVVSTNAASVVKNDITNQMTDAVESRAAIIDAYVLSAEEYMAAFALGSEVRDILRSPEDPVLLERAAIPGDRKAHDLTRQERRRLLELFKCFSVAVSGPRPVEEAIVTAGGVKVSEADPRTMQSKKVPGLFFAGELLDVDAYTGGFNLQIAWATGRAAGEGAAAFIDQAAT